MIFIANFKMMITAPNVIDLVHKNIDLYAKMTQQHIIVLCPSATALLAISKTISGSRIALGGQTCSPVRAGAFTGDISSADLAACGATYCLVGHSERRTLYHETDAIVAAKTKLLLEENLTPVVCIGETLEEYEAGDTLKVLRRQLVPILEAATPTQKSILIAYEPRWAIGTGLIPEPAQINSVFSFLKQTIEQLNQNFSFKLLYGGSVSSKTIPTLAIVNPLDGFLIGGASLDFQEFQKIVDCFS